MAKTPNHTVTPLSAPSAAAAEARPQVMKPSSLLSYLWDNFTPESLSNGDLEFLSLASEEASAMSQWLARHVNGIADLIDTEHQATSVIRSGALQEEDQPPLLHFIAAQIETIGEIARIGGEASFMLRNRLITGGAHE